MYLFYLVNFVHRDHKSTTPSRLARISKGRCNIFPIVHRVIITHPHPIALAVKRTCFRFVFTVTQQKNKLKTVQWKKPRK